VTRPDETQRIAIAQIYAGGAHLSEFNGRIWDYAEPAWREYHSAPAYGDLLRAAGFSVEEGSGGMPIAFAASWGQGSPGPGGYAEYDAVLSQSQQVVPHRARREGLHPWTAGHTDPTRRSVRRRWRACWRARWRCSARGCTASWFARIEGQIKEKPSLTKSCVPIACRF